MKQQQQQQQQFNINLEELENITCQNCAGEIFAQVVSIRQASPLISPTGKEHNFLIPIGFWCVKCGAIYTGEKKEEVTSEREAKEFAQSNDSGY